MVPGTCGADILGAAEQTSPVCLCTLCLQQAATAAVKTDWCTKVTQLQDCGKTKKTTGPGSLVFLAAPLSEFHKHLNL